MKLHSRCQRSRLTKSSGRLQLSLKCTAKALRRQLVLDLLIKDMTGERQLPMTLERGLAMGGIVPKRVRQSLLEPPCE